MWIAKLKEKNLIDGNLSLVIEYKRGREVITESYNSKAGDEGPEGIARKRVTELNALSDKFSQVDLDASIDLTAPTPAPAPTPTPDDVKRQEYNLAVFDLKRKSEFVDLGVLTEVEAGLAALRTTVKILGIDLGEL